MKATLSNKQIKHTDEIPELVGLLRIYIALDRVLLKYKTESLTEEQEQLAIRLIDRTKTLTDNLREISNELIPYSTGTYNVSKFANPELANAMIDDFIDRYKNARRNANYKKIIELQDKLLSHMKEVVDTIKEYRGGKYYVPKVVENAINYKILDSSGF